jgi:cytochrome P450
MATREPSIEFDHHSTEFGRTAPALFEDMVARCPVAFSESNGGYWVAASYEHARKVLGDDENFTVRRSADGSSGGLLIPSAAHAPRVWPGELDGADHDRLRRPVRTAFSRGYLERNLAPALDRIIDERIAAISAMPKFDITTDFSFPITVESIFTYVGLQEIEDKPGLILMLEDAFAIDPDVGEDREALAEATSPLFREATARIRAIIDSRRPAPTDDLIGVMLTADPPLSGDEIDALTMSLLLGGVRTTAASIDNVLWHLDDDRDLRQAVIARPEILGAVVDELVRIYSPSPLVARTVVEDIELAGAQLKAGDRIAAAICSANLDPARFGDPATVNPERKDGLHLAFGVGTHYCLGIWLAKLEITHAVGQFLARLPDYAVDRDRAKRYDHTGVNNGWATLPAVASPAA